MESLLTSAILLPVMAISSIPLFVYLYAILRWRSGGGGEPGLGSYGLVLTFRMISLLLVAGAFAQLLYAWRSGDEHAAMVRVCWGLIVAAAIFLLIHLPLGAVLRPPAGADIARRLFGGGLLCVSGMVSFGALVFYMVTAFEEVPESTGRLVSSHEERLKAAGSWLICFLVVYLGSVAAMSRSMRQTT
ncbi:MAG TPA: hypothetical protein VFY93_15985 [Planctomycetota bacterium]|nr:hypothetical protein [Planctomycetota bacterium]